MGIQTLTAFVVLIPTHAVFRSKRRQYNSLPYVKHPTVTSTVNGLNEFPALLTIPNPLARPFNLLWAGLGLTLPSVGGGITDQESRLMLIQAIATGRGGVFLRLTPEQYAKLIK